MLTKQEKDTEVLLFWFYTLKIEKFFANSRTDEMLETIE